jgi:hypothetical protein
MPKPSLLVPHASASFLDLDPLQRMVTRRLWTQHGRNISDLRVTGVSHVQCRIAKNDTYNLYLAYHEGQGGFLKNTYRRKAWLRRVASKAAGRAKTYKKQLASCEREFQKRGDCCLWPF